MFEAVLKIQLKDPYKVKLKLENAIKKAGYILIPKTGQFPDGHIEIVGVDKHRSEMVKFKNDPKARWKKEAQRAGLELNAFPASKGFYIYLTVRPYMELMDAPEIPGITADDIEQKTDIELCRDVFKSFLPKLGKYMDAKLISKTGPKRSGEEQSKTARKKKEPEFVVLQKDPGGEKALKQEIANITMKYDELMKDMERMRALGQKEKDACSNQKFTSFVMDISEVLDNLERASSDPNMDPEHIKGLGMVSKQFISVLENYQVNPIVPKKGVEFDPNYHESIKAKKTKKYPPDTILEVVRKGFIFQGHVLRPALVVVSKR